MGPDSGEPRPGGHGWPMVGFPRVTVEAQIEDPFPGHGVGTAAEVVLTFARYR